MTDKATVYFRVHDAGCEIKAASELTINPNHWSAELQGYKYRVSLVSEPKRRAFNQQVRELADRIAEEYRRGVFGDWLQRVIDEYHHPRILDSAGAVVDICLTEVFGRYEKRRGLSQSATYTFNSMSHKIRRFERYQREIMHRRSFSLKADTMTEHDLHDFDRSYIWKCNQILYKFTR